MLVPFAICGTEHGNLCKNSQVAQFAATDLPHCDISVQESCSKLNRRLMSRGFFFFFYHHHIQLHLKVMDGLFTECFYHHVLKIPRVTPATWCLLQVTIRALALSDTLADGGRLPPQRSVCDCFNVVVSVFCVPAKTQPHIN